MVTITRKLSRRSSHRQALLKNLVTSLIKEGQIKTTLHKAKEARRLADKVVELAKKGGDYNHRRVNSFVTDGHARIKLFDVYAKRFKERQGGYTRLIHYRNRKGDNAKMAILEYLPEDFISLNKKALVKASMSLEPKAETPKNDTQTTDKSDVNQE